MSIPTDIEAVEFNRFGITVKINSKEHYGYGYINLCISQEEVKKIKEKIVRILNRYE